MTPLEFTIDGFRTTTGLNSRENWRTRADRVRAERARVWVEIRRHCGTLGPQVKPPYVVTLTRISPRLADDDNLSGGLKSSRDEVATWLGTGDGPKSPVTWRYQQERGSFAVRIRVESGGKQQ